MKVEDFFKYENKDIVNFDFSQEVLRNTNVKKEYNEVKKLYLGNSLDYLSKYLIFKTTFKESDPDVNGGLLKDIYTQVWNKEILNCCLATEDRKYYSDTMTSAQGLLNDFYKFVYNEEKEENCQEIKKVKLANFIAMNDDPFKYPIFKKYFKDKNSASKIILDFVSHYHTLGNYIPVPSGFNQSRSGIIKDGIYVNYDMWDITLMKIKDYYQAKENLDLLEQYKIILELLHMQEVVEQTMNWLNKFASWSNFVDENYLKELEIDSKNKYTNYVNVNYDINPFFIEKHNFADPTFKCKQDFIDYFVMITNIIKDRTKIIQYNFNDKKKNDK